MSLTLNQRLQRMLVFLTNARRRPIFRQLGVYGFTKAELAKGWRLFAAMTGMTLEPEEDAGFAVGDSLDVLLQALDAHENRWFPVLKATLGYEMPAIAVAVFSNLGQTQGPAVVVSMLLLLDRIDRALQGAQGAELRALLDARGFTVAVQGEIRAIIERIQSVDGSTFVESKEDEEAAAAAAAGAAADAWAWYSQWRDITRVAIKDPALLRRLGLIATRKKKAEASEVTPEASD